MKPETSQTILLVNDNPDQLNLLSLLLSKAGYRILTANNGDEAIEIVSFRRPDLVISDVNMPGMDGIELCHRLRQESGTSLMPIMLVSAERIESENAVEGLRAGADDYLEAPYDPMRLVAKVARLLERKQGEEALRTSEARYRLMFAGNPLPMWVYDLETLKFLDVNEAAVRQYGYSRAEFLRMTIEAIRLPEAVPALHHALKALPPGVYSSGVWQHLKRDGTVIDVEITSHAISFEGRPAELVLANDITDRKRAEEKLKRSERLLAEAQRLAHVGSWDWDLLTGEVTWSDELYHIFGLKPQEITMSYGAYLQRLHSEDRQSADRHIEEALRRHGPFSYYSRVLHPDGSVRVLHSRGTVIVDEQGRPVRVFGTGQDVTEHVAFEEKLKHSNEKLRALSVRLQSVREEESIRIAREIHDELGGALTGLKMDVSWLGKRWAETSAEVVQQKLQAISELINETIEKVRNISTELRPSVLDDLGLAAAIEWHATEFQKRTEIECRITSLQEDISLSAEKATAVFRIFQEILTNVARHARAELVEVSMEERGGSLILKVADNGIGIRESDVVKNKSLGLLGMRERALVFGGEVDIRVGEGGGTVVTVSIPLVERDSPGRG